MKLWRRGPEPKTTDSAATEEDHDKKVDTNEQPLLSHLTALRRGLLRSVAVLVALFLPVFAFSNAIYEFVATPLMAHLSGEMIATDVASPFLTPLKLSVFAALYLAMRYILFEAWRFVAPGLYLREKRFAVPLLASSIFLFYLGTLFAYFIVFPLVFRFFALTTPSGVAWMTDISAYLNFVVKLFFAFGISFEIPVATFLIVAAGLTTPKTLSRARPYVFVGCFVFAMLLTPPDVISQLLLAVPCWVLYEVGILFSKLAKERPEEEAPTP
ncbi:MAG: twin-arginine translocase subunit TatC [Pseudomonadales bacterium]|nr:twin-arginine translocase subunit TatC [Pseudomonadales bacterium]